MLSTFLEEESSKQRVYEMLPPPKTTVNADEIRHFEALAQGWWDEKGSFALLHQLNPLRIQYIKDQLGCSLKGVRVLDIGCGGGLLAEPLTRLGAQVVGIDAAPKNIDVANFHAQLEGLDIEYHAMSLEEYRAQSLEKFDVVLALEIVEHVQDPAFFLENCISLLKDNGLFFVSTFHRTLKSYVLGILMAEYMLRWVPRGTHQWKKFMKPSEVFELLSPFGFIFQDLVGVTYDITTSQWKLANSVDVNYMGVLSKKISHT